MQSRPSSLCGKMQEWPLTVDKFIDHAARWHSDQEVVTRRENGAIERTNWASLRREAKRLSNALAAAGVQRGSRVATLAMNTDFHLAAWFGVMGMGAVCHTLNPRLSDDHLVYIINHAEDELLFADAAFRPLVNRIRKQCPSLGKVIFFDRTATDGWSAFLADHADECVWGGFDENTAAGLCYTSGTTGDPKGVLYSHRSNYLHTLMILQPDVFNINARDVVLPVVPMFHANAWGLTFAAAAVGAKFVLPGPHLDGASLFELLEIERVTFTAGVPTVWQTLLQYLEENDLALTSLKRVMIGGAAISEALYRAFENRGIEVQHNWGMTETSPLGTAASNTTVMDEMSANDVRRIRLKQGRVPIGVDMKVTNENGDEVPQDGEASGYLYVRGHSIASGYYKNSGEYLDANGYFNTGDVATIDPYGFMHITDRAKDVIKSGGEWISSIEIENIVLGHPNVALAAVIGVPHPKWDERPRLYIQLKASAEATVEEIKDFLTGKIAKWWMPDEVVFVDAIPIGATGKVDKKLIRKEALMPSDIRSAS